MDDDGTPSAGNLQFMLGAQSLDEGAGMASIPVERLGGSVGAVSVEFATHDGSAESGSDYLDATGTLDWPDGDGSAKSFQVEILDDLEVEGNEILNLGLSNPTGGAGLGVLSAATLSIVDNDLPPVGPCERDDETLCLNQDDRFQVEVTWRDFQGNTGSAKTFDIGRRDSGLFYFFNENNIEMLIKVIDACGLPGFENFWVFYAATTNVEFAVTVIDTETSTFKQYFNSLGEVAATVTDTAAFATCP